jgi:hypothetical protein
MRTSRADACLMVVWFGEEYLKFVADDMHVNLERLVLAVLKIKHDITAMVVRWLLSHAKDKRHATTSSMPSALRRRRRSGRCATTGRGSWMNQPSWNASSASPSSGSRTGEPGWTTRGTQAVWFIDPAKWAAKQRVARVNNGTKIQGCGPEIHEIRHDNPLRRLENPAA